MTTPDQSQGKSRALIWLVGLILLVILGVATCRLTDHKPPAKLAAVAQQDPPSPPVLQKLDLGSGVEVITRDEAAGLITLRDTKSGETVQLHTADYSREKAERAFAERIANRKNPAPSPHTPDPTALSHAAPPTPVTSPDPAREERTATRAPRDVAPTPAAVVAPTFDKNLPAFIPLYPGATTIKIAATTTNGVVRGNYEFSTPDIPDAIGKYYAKTMTDAGLLVIANVAGANQAGATYTLIAEDAAANKSLSLTASIDAGKSHGSIEFVSK